MFMWPIQPPASNQTKRGYLGRFSGAHLGPVLAGACMAGVVLLGPRI